MHLIKVQFMTNINLLHVLALDCRFQGVLQIKLRQMFVHILHTEYK